MENKIKVTGKDFTYDSETGEITEDFPGEYQFKKIETHEQVKLMMLDVLGGKLKAHEAVVYLTGALIDRIPLKLHYQDNIFKFFITRYDVFDDAYIKSTYSQTKVDTRLMIECPEYKEMKDSLDSINGFMNALTMAIDAVKMIDRSSWGRRQHREN